MHQAFKTNLFTQMIRWLTDRSKTDRSITDRAIAIPIAGLLMLVTSVSSIAEPVKLSLTPVATGLAAPVDIATIPDQSKRKLILDQVGMIYWMDAEGTLQPEPFLDIRDRLRDLEEGFEERGLLGMAIHPDFQNSGRVFVSYTAPLADDAPDGWNYTRIVSEFTVQSDNANALDTSTERVLLTQHWPSRKHNGGALAFGPDGYLYVGFGDGGGIHGVGEKVLQDAFNVPKSNLMWDTFAQDTQSLFGKILRLDVDSGYPGYGIPADNPFVGRQGRDEIYAYGFRNPYRVSFDPDDSGAFFVTAVAETLWEAIYRVDQPGNYGWPLREGSHCFDRTRPLDPPAECPQTSDTDKNGFNIVDPVVEYPNMSVHREGSQVAVSGVGTAVVGAVMYRGAYFQSLSNKLLFADWSLDFQKPSGQLFLAKPAEGDQWAFEKTIQFDTRIVALIQDEQELYVLTNDNFGPYGDTGKIFRIALEAQ